MNTEYCLFQVKRICAWLAFIECVALCVYIYIYIIAHFTAQAGIKMMYEREWEREMNIVKKNKETKQGMT